MHQGWVSDDFTTIYANDEFDEECQSGLLEDYAPLCHENYPNGIAHTNTYIFDITSLEDVGPPRIFTNTNAHPAVVITCMYMIILSTVPHTIPVLVFLRFKRICFLTRLPISI